MNAEERKKVIKLVAQRKKAVLRRSEPTSNEGRKKYDDDTWIKLMSELHDDIDYLTKKIDALVDWEDEDLERNDTYEVEHSILYSIPKEKVDEQIGELEDPEDDKVFDIADFVYTNGEIINEEFQAMWLQKHATLKIDDEVVHQKHDTTTLVEY